MRLFCGAIQAPQDDLENTLNFQAGLQGSKSQTTIPKAFERTPKRKPRVTTTDFCEHMVSAILLYESLVLRPVAVRISIAKSVQNEFGKNWETTEFNSAEPNKLSKWVAEIIPKSFKVWSWTPTCPSCCPDGPSGRAQAAKIAPRVSKVIAISKNAMQTHCQKAT